MFRSPSPTLLPLATLLTACAALLAIACADPIAEAPPRYTQRLELEQAPLKSPYSTSSLYAEAQRRRVARFTPLIERERDWCAEQFDDPDAVPELDPYEGILEWAQPATEEELVWMTAVAQATADSRGLALEAMPPIYFLPPDVRRVALCPLLLNPDSLTTGPLWHLDRLLGNVDPSWTPAVFEYLGLMLTAGWYVPADDDRGGYVALIHNRPLSREFLGVLAHEIVHALQDAHFGLTGADPEDIGSSDAAAAFSWVYEGDASFSPSNREELQELEALAAVEWSSGPRFERPPVALFDVFPSRFELGFDAYRLGRETIEAVYAREGYAGVNRLLSHPPPSTTQMMHPDALVADLQPISRSAICALTPAVLEDLPCDTYPQSDRLGEAFLRTFLAETTGQIGPAIKAAEGWRGDLVRVAERQGEGDLVLWQLVFAKQEEHNEAMVELRNWLIARSGKRARAAVSAPVIAWDGPTSAIRLVDHVRMLWLIVSDHPSFADRVALSALEITAKPFWWDD